MRLLLDTHILLWWIVDPSQIREDARLAIANGRNGVYVSPISVMEIVIKENLGKLTVPTALLAAIESSRFTELALTMAHSAELRNLPLLHKDPFDRTLIAQARIENLTLVTRDPLIEKYDVSSMAA